MAKEYGRFQITIDPTSELCGFYLENIYRDESFWLPLQNEAYPMKGPIAFIRFEKVGQHMFAITEVRQATGPIPGL